QKAWAERCVRAVSIAFPDSGPSAWPLCDRLLLQVRRSVQLIDEWHVESLEVARLLEEAGLYCLERTRLSGAAGFCSRGLAIGERVVGPEHRAGASSLDSLAEVFRAQGRYSDAEPLYRRSLAIRERISGVDDPNVASSLNNLALLYQAQGKYAVA